MGLDLQKSCKDNTENSHISSTQFPLLLTSCICYNKWTILVNQCQLFLALWHVNILVPPPGTEPTPSAMEHRVLTTRPPGNPANAYSSTGLLKCYLISFSCSRRSPFRTPGDISNCVSLGSFRLWHFLRLSLLLMSLTVLESSGQIFVDGPSLGVYVFPHD